jgi:hypothetical protein
MLKESHYQHYCSTGYQTLRNNFHIEYPAKLLKKNFRYELWVNMGLIREKTRGRTSCVTAPLMSKSALISRNNAYVGLKSTDMVDKLVLYARRATSLSPEV